MAFEHFSVGSGPTTGTGEARPGRMISSGTLFDPAAFVDVGIGIAGLENTANDSEWAPYDRMVQAPSFHSGTDIPFGTYVWQQDKILDRNPAGGAWRVAHSVTSQENLLDFGVKTGLICLFGTDSKPYLVGFYPGAGANEVGYVKFDINANVWTSAVIDVGGKFSNCTYAVDLDGKAYMASEGGLYIFDPAGDSITRIPTGMTSDWRDKVFVQSGRIFIAGIGGSSMRVYEYFGNVKLMSTVSTARLGVEVEFGVLNTRSAAYLMFYNSSREPRSFGVVAGEESLAAITVTDRTAAVWGFPIPLATDSRMTCRQDYDNNPKSDGGGFVVVQDTFLLTFSRYQTNQDTFRWNGPTSALTAINTNPGEHTYSSMPKGDGSHIHHGDTATDKDVVRMHEFIEPETPPVGLNPGVLGVRFSVFGATGAPATKVLRLLFASQEDNSGGIADTQGTIVSSSGGLLDGSGRLHTVPVSATGSGPSYFVLWWDRVADGVDITERHYVKLETKDNAGEFL